MRLNAFAAEEMNLRRSLSRLSSFRENAATLFKPPHPKYSAFQKCLALEAAHAYSTVYSSR